MDANEQQVATDLKDIRGDHLARYRMAASRYSGKHVVDAACGTGYGSYILAEAGCTVRRFDIDAEAVDFAQKHWSHENIMETYQADAMATKYPDGGYDVVVAFEMLEHLSDPLQALRNFKRMAPMLFASVPNQAVWPHNPSYTAHYRHYTVREFEELLNAAGYEVKAWWGQKGPYSEPEENQQGRTMLVEALATDAPQTETYKRLPAVRPLPQKVAIVAMGNSKDTYGGILSNQGGNRHRLWDEVWAINAMGGVIHCDRIYHMDDIKVQEIRAEARPESFVAGMLEWMRETDVPIITCKAYPDYPTSEEYPLKDVLDNISVPYLNTTVAYALADAIRLGVRSIGLYGVDFSYPNLHKREKGRGCVEFLLGVAAQRGIEIELAHNTTLLDANEPSVHVHKQGDLVLPARLYGYDTEKLTIEYDKEHGWTVQRENREELPTADEMEMKYAHTPMQPEPVQEEA